MEVAPRYTLLTLFKPLIMFNALHCLNSSIYAYIYCKGRLERYWNVLMNF